MLLFDAQGRPAYVVKAGLGETARGLIRWESAFLRSVPAGIPGMMKIYETFASGRIDALALDMWRAIRPRAVIGPGWESC